MCKHVVHVKQNEPHAYSSNLRQRHPTSYIRAVHPHNPCNHALCCNLTQVHRLMANGYPCTRLMANGYPCMRLMANGYPRG
eukprot:1158461-Pelagomonas_calceolata.AAC.6